MKPAIENGKPIRTTLLPFSVPSITKKEISAVEAVLRSGWLTTGPVTKKLEENFSNYIGCGHSVFLNSCTSALHLSLVCLGIGPGDEVIVPTMTFASTANAVVWTGAKPVFVDVGPDLNIDVAKTTEKINSRTRAVIPVDYGGRPCDLSRLLKIARKNGLKLIEDAAHSAGASYKGKKIGNFADCTCFSFYATKNMTTGEGGMLCTNSKKLADSASLMRLHGMSNNAWKRYGKGGRWFYEIKAPGYKYNPSDIHAAIGVEQLKRLDGFNSKRRAIAAIYDSAFRKNPTLLPIPFSKENVYHLYPIVLNLSRLKIGRSRFIEALREENISSSVHFIPLHLQPFYKQKFGYKQGDFPIAEKIYSGLISLPLFPGMGKSDVLDVIMAVDKLTQYYGR